MKNKIFKIIVTVISILSICNTTVSAAPIETSDIIEAFIQTSDKYVKRENGDGILLHTDNLDDYKHWSDYVNSSINTVFRSCSLNTIYPIYSYGPQDGDHYIILSSDQLKTLADHQKAVDEWAHFVASQLFPSGTDRGTVLQTSFLHIVRNYPYDDTATSWRDSLKCNQAQDAYYMITNGSGICASYAKAFRALIEAVPFNPETHLVDWECNNPAYIKVAIVKYFHSNVGHEWNAIQESDGS